MVNKGFLNSTLRSLQLEVGPDAVGTSSTTAIVMVHTDQDDETSVNVLNRNNTVAEVDTSAKLICHAKLNSDDSLTGAGMILGNDLFTGVATVGTTAQNRLCVFSNAKVDGITVYTLSTTGTLEFRTGTGAVPGRLVGNVTNAGVWTFPEAPLPVPSGGTDAVTLTDGGVLLGSGTGAITALAQPTNGQLVVGSTSADPVLASLTAPAAGLTITGGAGTITFALADGLAALEALASTGLVAHTAADTYTERTLTGTTNQIAVTDGDGVSGNPTIALASEVVNSTQPCFLVHPTANTTNVTGDNTNYTMVWGTEVFDQGGDFDGTSTYTAPVAARHIFTFVIGYYGTLSGHDLSLATITTSNRSYDVKYHPYNYADVNGVGNVVLTVIADMDESDTCTVTFRVSGSTKVVDIAASGGGQSTSYFSGCILA